MKAKIKPVAPEDLPYFRYKKVRRSGHILELKEAEKRAWRMPIEKYDANEYVVRSTGELLPYKHQDNRSDNLKSIKDTMSKARAIINANFTGGNDQLWVTLTYAVNMTDSKVLYKDFKGYIEKLRAYVGSHIEYFSIAEPQGRGAWHVHILYKRTDGKTLEVNKEKMEKLWGHGFCKVQRLKNADNVGAYVSAYCCNTPYADDTRNGDGSKAYVKGGRLHMYPNGMNFYRLSRGLIIPEWRDPTKKELAVSEMASPEYCRSVGVYDMATSERLNAYRYRQYNTKRINKQSNKNII